VFRRRPTPEAEAAARDRLSRLAAQPGVARGSTARGGTARGRSAGAEFVGGGVGVWGAGATVRPDGQVPYWIVAPGLDDGVGQADVGSDRRAVPDGSVRAAPGGEGVVRDPVAGWSGEGAASAAIGPASVPDPGGGVPERVTRPGGLRSVVAAALPASLRGARIDPGRRGVVVLAVIALVAALVAGVNAWRARPTPEPLGVPAPAEVSAAPSTGPLLVVAVAGKVRRPGVVRLPAGSRVADAIAAAGGVLPGADLGLVNLARKLVDGEQVVVGVPAPAAGPVGAAPPLPGSGSGALLDLNTATVAQLDALPGVGPVLAQRLVEYRTANGGFRSVDQLREVDGIGESRFQKLKELVTV